MELSERILGLTGGGPDGWDIFRRARAMQRAGRAVTDLTIGEPDCGTDPAILEAMYRAARAGHTGYAAVPGVPALRAAVAARVAARSGVATGPENVLITPGGQAALFAAHAAVCDPGDRALYVDPYYATYPGTIRGVGAVPVPVIAQAADGFRPRGAAIEAAAAGGARSILVNTPNNPTGVVYDAATLHEIAVAAEALDLWVISDEVYDTQVWDGRHHSLRALPGMAERTLVVGSMSKSHAMTGSRLGWIVGPETAIAHLANLATHTTYGVPGFIQDAGLWALEQGAALEEAVAAPLRRRRARALALLAGQSAVGVVPPGGAMYLMLDVRATGMDGETFAARLLEEEAIAVMPGESFGRAAAGHVRVAMTVEDARLESALDRLVALAGGLADAA